MSVTARPSNKTVRSVTTIRNAEDVRELVSWLRDWRDELRAINDTEANPAAFHQHQGAIQALNGILWVFESAPELADSFRRNGIAAGAANQPPAVTDLLRAGQAAGLAPQLWPRTSQP
jgi:hypothetical protein